MTDILVGESIALPEGESLYDQPESVQWEDATDAVSRAARAQAWALVADARAAGLRPCDVGFAVTVELTTVDGDEIEGLRSTEADA